MHQNRDRVLKEMKNRFFILIVCAWVVSSCNPKKDLLKNTLTPISAEQQEMIFKNFYKQILQSKYVFVFPPGSPQIPEEKDNPRTQLGVQLGRWLFYDTILSEDLSMACASCHQQKFSFSDNKSYSLGVHGEHTGFNSMSLVNLAWQPAFFWDGRVKTLREQVLEPIKNTRELNLPLDKLVQRLSNHRVYPKFFRLVFSDGKISTENISKALSQFLSTLVSFNSPLDEIRRVEMGLKKESEIAFELRPFLLEHMDSETRETVNLCGSCHNGRNLGEDPTLRAIYGGTKMTNNGLPVERDSILSFIKIKVPELRNVEHSAPYMHDGRFSTLSEVIDHYDSHLKLNPVLDPLLKDDEGKARRLHLSAKAKQNLIHYLKLMTDTAFLSNPEFSDPFQSTFK